MNERELLLKEIDEKEKQLNQLEQESNAWNSGAHKNTSIAITSRIYVDALRENIKQLKINVGKI